MSEKEEKLSTRQTLALLMVMSQPFIMQSLFPSTPYLLVSLFSICLGTLEVIGARELFGRKKKDKFSILGD